MSSAMHTTRSQTTTPLRLQPRNTASAAESKLFPLFRYLDSHGSTVADSDEISPPSVTDTSGRDLPRYMPKGPTAGQRSLPYRSLQEQYVSPDSNLVNPDAEVWRYLDSLGTPNTLSFEHSPECTSGNGAYGWKDPPRLTTPKSSSKVTFSARSSPLQRRASMPLPATLRQKIAERLAASFSTNVRIQNLEARVRELEARNIDGITPPSLTPQQDARLLHMVGERPWDEIANHLRLPVWVLKARYNEITPFKTAANNRNSVPKHPAVGFSAEEVAQIMQMRQRGDSWSEVGEAIGKVVNRVGEKYELLVRRSTLSDTMPVAKTSAKVATVVGTGIRKQVRKKSRGVLSQYAARTLSGPSFDRACSTRNDVDRKHRNEEDSSYLGFTMSDDFNILRLHLKARSWEQIAEVLGRSVSEIKTRFDELVSCEKFSPESVSHTVEEMEGNDTVIINTDKDALPENDSYEDVVTFIQDSELAARYTNKAKGKAPQDAVTRKLSATNQSDTALDSEVPVRAPTPARIRTCSAEMFAEDFKASRSSLIRRMRTKTPSIVSAKTLRGFFSSKSKKSL